MRRWLPVLLVITGLGCHFSSGQTKPTTHLSDPFDRYLAGVKANHRDSSLRGFATQCKIGLSQVQPKFAVSVGGDWRSVKNLAKGLSSLESDFYSTAEVWKAGNRILVEIWSISADVGSEVRIYRCFDNGKLLQAESIDWNVPLDQADPPAWGYSRRWERAANDRMQIAKSEFVDGLERTIPKPKLDAEGERSLKWQPSLGSLSELRLPPALLQ
jgi:hypothetical protein